MSRAPHHEDRSLVRKLLDGDRDAFEGFFDDYYPRLYRFALVRTDQEDVAEDVVQETLCRVMRKLHTYRGEAALFSWLCTFCRREISAYYRRTGQRRSRVPLLEEIPEIREALESLPGSRVADPEDDFRRRELSRLVQLGLDHLPTRYAEALEWKYVQGLSVREIAARSGVSEKAAESVLSRARQSFRDGFLGILDELAALSSES